MPAERESSKLQKFAGWFNSERILIILLISSIIFGFAFGFGIGSVTTFTPEQIDYITFPGTIFMNMLKCMIIPLIVSSLISSLASLDSKVSGKLGLRAIVYYLSTTFIAVIVGIIMVVSIKPGSYSKDEKDPSLKNNNVNLPIQYAFMDLIRNALPPNIVEAAFRSYVTRVVLVENEMEATLSQNLTSAMNVTQTMITPENLTSTLITVYQGSWSYQMNIMGLVAFSIALGIVLGRMGEEGKPLTAVFLVMNEATMKLVMAIMWFAPIGIFFLILGMCFGTSDWASVMARIGMYFVTVVTGLLVHGLIILPLIYLVICRRNPFIYLKGLSPALFTALGTASSSATLPMTFRCLEENNGVDKRITRFILPIGATINMDGTALYEAVAAIFIAQYNDIDLSIGQIITVSITATTASIGAAGIPQAGLVTMVIVLTSVGLPTTDIALIFTVDIILDRIRTTVNVEGDSIGAALVEKLSQKELREAPTSTCVSDYGENYGLKETDYSFEREKSELDVVNKNGSRNNSVSGKDRGNSQGTQL